MNIKDFLISNSIDYTLYKLTVTEIYDIILYDKQVTQSVKTELMQYREQHWDWLDENKKEFSRSHKFLKNDLPVWKYIIRWIEPDTLQFDDCRTCDWHWTIVCWTCSWKWELICPKCLWKTQFLVDTQKTRSITWQCQICKWKWIFIYTCKKCNWYGSIKYYETCLSCFWKWQIFNQQTQQWWYCQQCRGIWKLEKIMPCQWCKWKWQITQWCTKCNWTWQYSWIKSYIEKVMISCNYCSQTWRIKCNTCNWNQELICPTCHWERKTYQCYMNIFRVEVKNLYNLLLNRTLNQDAINTIWQENKNTVTKINENEKKMLINYWKMENLKIWPESIWRVDWILYKLESIESWECYFIWYSKIKNQYFYINLPPKNNLEEFIVALYKSIFRFFTKIYWYFTKIMNYLKNKKNY